MGPFGGRSGRGGEAYVRIQNRSSHPIRITFLDRNNVDESNLDDLSGDVAVDASLPRNGGERPFANGFRYATVLGRDGLFDSGHVTVEARVPGARRPTSTLRLIVNDKKWTWEDLSPDAASPIRLVADANEERCRGDDDSEFWKVELRVYDNIDTSKWMEVLGDRIKDLPLNQVGLPGTHDSGTYTFDKEMGASPDSDLTKTIEKFCPGMLGGLADSILGTVFRRLCQCQSRSVLEQLRAGVRYFDLRIARHAESGRYFTCHGVFCADMSVLMKELGTFLSSHPREIVVLDFNHLYEMDGHHGEFLKIVFDVLGERVAYPKWTSAISPVSEFWEKKKQAVVIYHAASDKLKDLPFANKIYHNGYIHSPWPEANATDVLHSKLTGFVASRHDDKHKNQLFVLQGMLTPDVELIKSGLMNGDGLSIRAYANRASPKVMDWCEDEWMVIEPTRSNDTNKKRWLNIVIVDFIEGVSIIPAIIDYNRRL